MQFLINTSLEPFGCALIQDHKILEISLWDDFRKGGEASWEFLDTHKNLWSQITLIGGVSGPGGFSNLRVAGVILNALSLKLELPIHQVRADKVVESLLSSQNKEALFLLNSFGSAVFESDQGNLKRLELEQAVDKFGSTETCVSFLPTVKQAGFTKPIVIDKEQLYPCIGSIIQSVPPQSIFVPDYEYPAVQS